jgi:hypothetical protein
MGASLLDRFGAFIPLCASSIPASAPPAWIASAILASAGRSPSSHRRSSMKGVISELGCISTCSVQTTAQPPSALTLRMAAWAVGSRYPMPLQCGTWKNRFLARTGPSWTGSNRMS